MRFVSNTLCTDFISILAYIILDFSSILNIIFNHAVIFYVVCWEGLQNFDDDCFLNDLILRTLCKRSYRMWFIEYIIEREVLGLIGGMLVSITRTGHTLQALS